MRSEAERLYIRRRVDDFKEAVSRFVGLLSAKDVRVIFRGSECRTDGKLIVLPSLSILEDSDATDEQVQSFIDAIIGFVDHEVAHVMFSDMEFWAHESKELDLQVRILTNAIEDAFVERELTRLWKGSAKSLERCSDYSIKARRDEYRGKPVFLQVGLLLFFRLKGEVYERVSEYFDQELVRWFEENLQDEVEIANTVKSTQESLKLAKAINAKLELAFSEPPKEQEDQDEDDGEKGQDGRSAASDNRVGRSRSPPCKNVGDGADAEEPTPNDACMGSGGRGQEVGTTTSHSEGWQEAGEVLTSALDRMCPAGGVEYSRYAPYTTEGDYIGPMDRTTAASWSWLETHMNRMAKYSDVISRVFKRPFVEVFSETLGPSDMHKRLQIAEDLARRFVGPLRTSLVRVLKARSTAYLVRDLPRGTLDRRRLHKAAFVDHGRPRVYQEKLCGETFDVAVLLAVNESGSMLNFADSKNLLTISRMYYAAAASLALGDVLHGLGIKFGVFGHTTGDPEIAGNRINSATTLDKTTFHRFGDLRVEWIKRFDASWVTTRHRVGGLYAQCSTYDAEVVRYGASRLVCDCPDVRRRILIMLDDGDPSPCLECHKVRHCRELKLAVQEVTAAGVECIGVGMATPSVSEYYPDHVTVMNLEELPAVLLSKFGELLGATRRKHASGAG